METDLENTPVSKGVKAHFSAFVPLLCLLFSLFFFVVCSVKKNLPRLSERMDGSGRMNKAFLLPAVADVFLFCSKSNCNFYHTYTHKKIQSSGSMNGIMKAIEAI